MTTSRLRADCGKSEVKILEKDFQVLFEDLCHLYGWHVAHFRASRTKYGWTTAVSADGKGFVDNVCVRDRVIWVELKAEDGKTSAEQEAWHGWLRAAGQVVYVWCPSDFDEIQECLR